MTTEERIIWHERFISALFGALIVLAIKVGELSAMVRP